MNVSTMYFGSSAEPYCPQWRPPRPREASAVYLYYNTVERVPAIHWNEAENEKTTKKSGRVGEREKGSKEIWSRKRIRCVPTRVSIFTSFSVPSPYFPFPPFFS